MRSLWLLNELQAPFELIDMPFDLSVMRSREYLSVHPSKPAIGQFMMVEARRKVTEGNLAAMDVTVPRGQATA